MLKGLDPLLSPELLGILRAMGHGDDIVVVDANFPAASAGPRVVRLDGATAVAVVDAILSVMPLDDYVPEAVWRMEVVGQPDAEQPIFEEFRSALRQAEGDRFTLGKLERFAFYAKSKAAFAIVVTGERRLYGNLILKKGVVRPH
jgi:L-fucose mutarotase